MNSTQYYLKWIAKACFAETTPRFDVQGFLLWFRYKTNLIYAKIKQNWHHAMWCAANQTKIAKTQTKPEHISVNRDTITELKFWSNLFWKWTLGALHMDPRLNTRNTEGPQNVPLCKDLPCGQHSIWTATLDVNVLGALCSLSTWPETWKWPDRWSLLLPD